MNIKNTLVFYQCVFYILKKGEKIMQIFHSLFNYKLSSNALKVYVYLLYCQNQLGNAVVRISTIQEACNIASAATVQKSLHELESKGLVSKYRRRNMEGNTIANGYSITQLSGRWTPLSSNTAALLLQLPKTSVACYLYLLKCANRTTGKAFPSITKMQEVLKLARNSVVQAIKDLVDRHLLKKAPLRAGKHNLYKLLAVCAESFKKAQKKSKTVTHPSCPKIRKNHLTENFLIQSLLLKTKSVNILDRLLFFCRPVVQKLTSSILPTLGYKRKRIKDP